MAHYDLALAWCWKYDADFVRLLDSACQAHGLSLLQVTASNVEAVLADLQAGQLTFGSYLDRSEHEARYEPVFRWASRLGAYRINPREVADWAEDKATMHLELINAGLVTPYTIILPPSSEQPNLPALDLQPLGEQFVIKPCYGGGGEGVVMGATSMEDVRSIRTQYPHLKYLLQKTIRPQKLGERDAWFRVIFCDGQHYLCWWDPSTHIYKQVSAEEEIQFGLTPLREITTSIANLCRLVFFSTEIAFSLEQQQWVIIDYVNDQIDMRLQSQAVDGVPDALVEKVSLDLARMVRQRCS